MRNFRLASATFLVFLLVVIAVQNAEVVSLRLLVWQFEVSRILLVLVTTAIGFLLGTVVARWPRGRQG